MGEEQGEGEVEWVEEWEGVREGVRVPEMDWVTVTPPELVVEEDTEGEALGHLELLCVPLVLKHLEGDVDREAVGVELKHSVGVPEMELVIVELRHREEVALVVVDWERVGVMVEERHWVEVESGVEKGEGEGEMEWVREMVGVVVEDRQLEGVEDPHMDWVVVWERLPEVVADRQCVGVADTHMEGVEVRHREGVAEVDRQVVGVEV